MDNEKKDLVGLSNNELARRMLAGDRAASKELVERQKARVRNRVLRAVHNPADAGPILNALGYKILRLKNWEETGRDFSHWVDTVLTNEIRVYKRSLRSQKNARFQACDEIEMKDEVNPERRLIARQHLNAVLQSVSPEHRPLVESLALGKTGAEISASCGWTLEATYREIKKIRRALSKLSKEELFGE